MSRIGRLPIPVPNGVEVTLDGQSVVVKGPKGTLTHTVPAPITIDRAEDGTLQVARPDDERASRSLHGLTRSLVANMVTGVTDGYAKAGQLPRVLGGLGVAIISTSSGLLTDRQANKKGVGGEVLAYVY